MGHPTPTHDVQEGERRNLVGHVGGGAEAVQQVLRHRLVVEVGQVALQWDRYVVGTFRK